MAEEFGGYMGSVEEVCRISVGGTYRQHHLQVVRGEGGDRTVQDVSLGLVAVEAFAYDEQTMRDMVVFRCLSGPETGRLKVSTQEMFANAYRRVQPAQPVSEASPPPPQKVAGVDSSKFSDK